MQPVVYRGPPEDGLLIAPLDEFTAVYHRASGITHLLIEPAPQILAVLRDGAVALDALLDRLGRDFELQDADRAALAARLDELIEAGLVERL